MSFKTFSELVISVASSTKTLEKEEALIYYFENVAAEEKIWALALFTGRKIKKPFTTTQMKNWCIEVADIPEWLFEECYQNVGDISETIALLLPDFQNSNGESLQEQIVFLQNLATLSDENKKDLLIDKWLRLSINERFVFNKLISGNFRIGVSAQTVINALSKQLKIDAPVLSHRLAGKWTAEETTFNELIFGTHLNTDLSKPYPFYLAYPLEENLETLGNVSTWQAEWKWDGIRGQIVFRNGEIFIWSRGEELITEKFPELQALKNFIPEGTVLDGEIITFKNEKPLPFQTLQTRIGRKNLSKKILEEAPAAFIVYDLMEWNGQDARELQLLERRHLLENIFANGPRCGVYKQHLQNQALLLSPTIQFNSWEELSQIRKKSREMNSEGLMLKRKTSIYQVGRKRGDWWKWKVEPFSVDAVLVAAQKGHGRRANLYTDYTFALRDGENLVTFAKAYSGLTDKEFAEVDAFVKQHIIEKFGPVRTVKPELIFEIGFEGIAQSNRHKCGVAVRFPRMLRWRKDKKLEDADTVERLKALLTISATNDFTST